MTTVAQPVTRHSPVGFGLALVGLMVATVALIVSIVTGSDFRADRELGLATSFGLTTLGFAFVKIGIAAVLAGILVRLKYRVDATKAALPRLRAASVSDAPAAKGVDVTDQPKKPLPIHKMAEKLWRPMLAMGAMAVVVGFIVSIAWANADSVDSFQTTGAWAQGLMFLGEGFLLAGISFLLGSILSGLRKGGGEVQQALGLRIQTLKMPATAKAFIGLMMLGTMVAMLQFVLYLVTIGVEDPTSVVAWWAWLGPFRELGLGLLLAGIVLALATIGKALNFQFARIVQIVKG